MTDTNESSTGSFEPAGPALLRAAAVAVLPIVVWISWMELSPAIGFPDAGAAAVMGRAVGSGSGSWVGWALLIAALGGAAAVYLGAAAWGMIRSGPLTGAAFGALVWLVAGMLLMPLMGGIDPGTTPGANSMPPGMPSEGGPARDVASTTFMMLHLGPLAPVGALIAWLLFGSILGAASRRGRGRVGVGR